MDGQEQQPPDLSSSERWLIGGALGVAALLLLVALLVPMVVGWRSADEPEWWGWLEAVLINLGAAIALVAPIEWFGSRLRHRVEESEARQDRKVEEVREASTDRLDELSARVDALSELERRVDERLDEAVEGDHQAFRAVASNEATGRTALDAIGRASRRGLVSARGVRVPFNEAGNHFLYFTILRAERSRVRIQVGDAAGSRIGTFDWTAATTAEDMVLRAAEVVRKTGSNERPNPRTILETLAETLVYADKHEDARPIIQYLAPQWAVTDTATVAGRGSGYGYHIAHGRTDRLTMSRHVRDKNWLDEDSFEDALLAAEQLFPPSQEQRNYLAD